MENKVSAVIITHNESVNIQRTLNKLYWCDEIIVVDSNSTDDTVSICMEYGCKVYYHNFIGFGEQKNFAISKAKNEWVLCIDADEVLTFELIDEIQTTLQNPGKCRAYQIPMHLVFRGFEFKYGKESNTFRTRLFNTNFTTVTFNKVHEGFETTGEIKKLNNIIQHYSYRNIHHYITKLNTYSTFGAEMCADKNKTKGQFFIFISLPFNFLKYYIFDGNFMNGKNGFYWSALSSFYHFIKYVKTQDIQQSKLAVKPVAFDKKPVIILQTKTAKAST